MPTLKYSCDSTIGTAISMFFAHWWARSIFR